MKDCLDVEKKYLQNLQELNEVLLYLTLPMTHKISLIHSSDKDACSAACFLRIEFRFWIMSDLHSDLEISWADEAESPSNRRTWLSLFWDLESDDELINGIRLP